jgi:hypothetical protein
MKRFERLQRPERFLNILGILEHSRQFRHLVLRIDERREAQGTRHTAVKAFSPYALGLEPYASLTTAY